MVNVPNSLNNLKTKVDGLDVGKLKTATVDFKKLSDAVQHRWTKFRKKIGDVDKKLPNTSGLVTTTVLNAKISEVIPDTSCSITTTVLNSKLGEFEYEISNHDKYITTSEFIKLIAKTFTARLKQADLVSKTDFDNKLTSFNRKISSNKTKYLEVQRS